MLTIEEGTCMMKLTLVSVTARGRKLHKFVRCEHVKVDGKEKAIVPQTVIDGMLTELGVRDRGETYSVG
jgi:hypothetical protein